MRAKLLLGVAAGLMSLPISSASGWYQVKLASDAGTGIIQCPRANECTLGGPKFYSELNGHWSFDWLPHPSFRYVSVYPLSCPEVGQCVTGGDGNIPGGAEAFVSNESTGVWEPPHTFGGFVNSGGFATVTDVSCDAVSDCSAIGWYQVNHGDSNHRSAFVVTETNGAWGSVQAIPGLHTLNAGQFAMGLHISCYSRGNCAAAGTYVPARAFDAGSQDVFVVEEVNGHWEAAGSIGGLGVGTAAVDAISCVSSGTCTLAGWVLNPSTNSYTHPFVTDNSGGMWHRATILAATLAYPGGEAVAIACWSTGSCVAGGDVYHQAVTTSSAAILWEETKGRWSGPLFVPGTFYKGGRAGVSAVACDVAGHCAVGGTTQPTAEGVVGQRAFATSGVAGNWKEAVQFLPKGDTFAQANAAACPPTGACMVGGSAGYMNSDGAWVNHSLLLEQ